jgi:hypothetical protein
MTSFFRFVNKRASYPFGIISLAHAPVNVTDFSIGSINCVRQKNVIYIGSINMEWRILVFYPEPEARDKIYRPGSNKIQGDELINFSFRTTYLYTNFSDKYTIFLAG